MTSCSLADFRLPENIKNLAVVGAGPTLDLNIRQIREYLPATLFLVTDSAAQGFLSLYQKSERLIFTVEQRQHNYLRNLENEHIAVYEKSRHSNLPAGNTYYTFNLVDDSERTGGFNLVSPGTVTGTALVYACYLAEKYGIGRINLYGVDLSFPDYRIYSRLVSNPRISRQNRFACRENTEFKAVLAGSDTGRRAGGSIIRTSGEFARSEQNMRSFIDNLPPSISFYDYSPLGIVHRRVEKKMPLDLAD